MNKYNIYMNQLLEGEPTEWVTYFENISYESGIKFLQSMRNVVNVKYSMTRNQPRGEYISKGDPLPELKTTPVIPTVHAHQRLRQAILENAFPTMTATQAAEQAGFEDPYAGCEPGWGL